MCGIPNSYVLSGIVIDLIEWFIFGMTGNKRFTENTFTHSAMHHTSHLDYSSVGTNLLQNIYDAPLHDTELT